MSVHKDLVIDDARPFCDAAEALGSTRRNRTGRICDFDSLRTDRPRRSVPSGICLSAADHPSNSRAMLRRDQPPGVHPVVSRLDTDHDPCRLHIGGRFHPARRSSDWSDQHDRRIQRQVQGLGVSHSRCRGLACAGRQAASGDSMRLVDFAIRFSNSMVTVRNALCRTHTNEEHDHRPSQ
jgi:hypothetical protein